MISILSILGWRSSTDSEVSGTELGGSNAVISALESRRFGETTPDIRFGEVRLVDRAPGPITDLHAVFPTSTDEGSSKPANVEFELPEDPEDEEAELNQFLIDLGVGSVSDVEDLEVASVRRDGVLLPDVEAVEEDDTVDDY